MSTIGDTRYVERPQFFDGQRLMAMDLQGLEAFNREMRWLHNRSLHQSGIGRGFAVTGKKGARELTIGAGYAIDALGREIVLTGSHVETVPPVAGEADGTPVHYDLTVGYPLDEDLEEAETREGVCLPRGVVRLREEPIFCWVRLERNDPEGLQARDPRLKLDIEDGLKIVLARVAVAHCQLHEDASAAERRSARPPRQPYVACGESAVKWRIETFGDFLFALSAEVGTADAAFGNTPCYVARVKGGRPKVVHTVWSGDRVEASVLDLTTHVESPAPDRFTVFVPFLIIGFGRADQLMDILRAPGRRPKTEGAVAAAAARLEFPDPTEFSDWHVEWIGIEGDALRREDPASFLYLNREGAWLGFELWGLEQDDGGTLRLASLPLRLGELPAGLAAFPAPEAPAGVTVAPDGTVYYSDPAGHSILRIDSCEGTSVPVPCLSGGDDSATRLREPRGILYHPRRSALMVADSGSHRVLVFDPETFRLLDVWGEPGHSDHPKPSALPGRLDTPWALAGAPEGSVYVVDYGNRRVQKFDLRGRVVPSFWSAVAGGPAPLGRPTDVAVATTARTSEVFILDADGPRGPRVGVFDPEGVHLRSFDIPLALPMGLVVGPVALYFGDNAGRGVLRLVASDGCKVGCKVGRALGYEGPVAALALDPSGILWLHPGTGRTLVRFDPRAAHVGRGLAWAGPFKNPIARATFRDELGDPSQWHRVKASLALEGLNAHAQIFVHASCGPPPPPVDPDQPVPFPHPGWDAFPLDATEGLLPGRPLDKVWVGVELTSVDGLHSAALSQMRIDFDLETPVQYLPAIYREDPRAIPFLARLLFLSHGFFEDVEAKVARLSRLFDAHGTPTEFLSWLARWLAVDLRERWPEEKKREAIARAFDRHGRRGTAEGLRTVLRFEAEVEARVEEPILQAAWWSLPSPEARTLLEGRNSTLGFTTRLAAAPAEGAVLGTTAVLDQSHLIRGEDRGSPLFDDVAHQFLVQVSRADAPGEEKLREIRTLVDREKPAHTAYHLCVVEPLMRVGFQALVGIDTIVAGAPSPSRLGDPLAASGLVLGGEPAGHVGRASRVGETTRLGAGSGS